MLVILFLVYCYCLGNVGRSGYMQHGFEPAVKAAAVQLLLEHHCQGHIDGRASTWNGDMYARMYALSGAVVHDLVS